MAPYGRYDVYYHTTANFGSGEGGYLTTSDVYDTWARYRAWRMQLQNLERKRVVAYRFSMLDEVDEQAMLSSVVIPAHQPQRKSTRHSGPARQLGPIQRSENVDRMGGKDPGR